MPYAHSENHKFHLWLLTSFQESQNSLSFSWTWCIIQLSCEVQSRQNLRAL